MVVAAARGELRVGVAWRRLQNPRPSRKSNGVPATGSIRPVGMSPASNGQVTRGGDPQPVTRRLAAQVEVRMAGQIDGSRRVGAGVKLMRKRFAGDSASPARCRDFPGSLPRPRASAVRVSGRESDGGAHAPARAACPRPAPPCRWLPFSLRLSAGALVDPSRRTALRDAVREAPDHRSDIRPGRSRTGPRSSSARTSSRRDARHRGSSGCAGSRHRSAPRPAILRLRPA